MTFLADVKGWSDRAKRNADLIFKQSAQDVINGANLPRARGGNMRVDTGWLRSSLTVSLTDMAPINPKSRPPSDAGPGSFQPSAQTVAVITGAEIGDTIYASWSASYAAIREERDGFMRLAAQDWPRIVAENAARLP